MRKFRGYVQKRCGCRGEDGKQLGQQCPKLASKGHGLWGYIVQETEPGGKRRQTRRGGYKLKREAEKPLPRPSSSTERWSVLTVP